jgi:hypothetical protein
VYYTEDGEVDGYTLNGAAAGGNTIDELRSELQRMLDSLDKEVLTYEE